MPSIWRRAAALARIVRPGNVLLTALSVFVGGVCAYAPWGAPLLVACASAALIAAGGYAINDVFDVEIDRVNRPDRPLPKGDLTAPMAAAWAALLVAAGVALSFVLAWPARAIACAAAASLVAYAARLKRVAIVGHVTVASTSALAFPYGGLCGPEWYMALVPAALAWAFHFGRELLKAAADVEGDSVAGVDTAAARWGVRATCRLAAIPLALIVILSPVPAVKGWFGAPYLLMVVPGVDAVLVHVVRRAWSRPDAHTASQLATLLKWDMLAGLVAVGGDRWMSWLPVVGH